MTENDPLYQKALKELARSNFLNIIRSATDLLLENTMLRMQLEELKRDRDRWMHEAHIDELTGLPNRRAFMTHLEAHASKGGKAFALLLIDMRGLGDINKHHGMPIADKVLKHLAKQLRMVLRSDDTIFLARFAGDEFAVLIEADDLTFETIQLIGERILKDASVDYRRRGTDVVIPVHVCVGGHFAATGDHYQPAAANLEHAKQIAKGQAQGNTPLVITKENTR